MYIDKYSFIYYIILKAHTYRLSSIFIFSLQIISYRITSIKLDNSNWELLMYKICTILSSKKKAYYSDDLKVFFLGWMSCIKIVYYTNATQLILNYYWLIVIIIIICIHMIYFVNKENILRMIPILDNILITWYQSYCWDTSELYEYIYRILKFSLLLYIVLLLVDLNLVGFKWSFLHDTTYTYNILLPHKDDIVYSITDLILSSTLTKRMVESSISFLVTIIIIS